MSQMNRILQHVGFVSITIVATVFILRFLLWLLPLLIPEPNIISYGDIIEVLSIVLAIALFLRQSRDSKNAALERTLADILNLHNEYLVSCLHNPDLDVFVGQVWEMDTLTGKKEQEQWRRILMIQAININIFERFFLWSESGGRKYFPDQHESWIGYMKELFRNSNGTLPRAWDDMKDKGLYDQKFIDFIETEIKIDTNLSKRGMLHAIVGVFTNNKVFAQRTA